MRIAWIHDRMIIWSRGQIVIGSHDHMMKTILLNRKSSHGLVNDHNGGVAFHCCQMQCCHFRVLFLCEGYRGPRQHRKSKCNNLVFFPHAHLNMCKVWSNVSNICLRSRLYISENAHTPINHTPINKKKWGHGVYFRLTMFELFDALEQTLQLCILIYINMTVNGHCVKRYS